MTYFELNLRFVERENYDQNELIAAEMHGTLVGWEKVLESRSSVIVAPANFGKTTEMRHKSEQLRAKGECAVFVVLRQLVDSKSFEDALGVEELDAYRSWKKQPDRCLTVFVDSLDEAAAGRDERAARLVKKVADELEWPNERVRWVISTRPAVLTPDVFEQLSRLLSVSVTTRSEQDSGVDEFDTIGKHSKVKGQTSELQAPTRLFSMTFLDDQDAAAYLKNCYQRNDAEQLIETAIERGLSGFVRSPGGLNILAHIDILQNPPTSLTEVFERVARAIGELRSSDPRLEDIGYPDPVSMNCAAQRLAAASLVCQLDNIEMPQEPFEVPANALSARLIVSSDLLLDKGIKQLLNSQLFIDSGFHQVKMYPEEIRPFLAAKRFSELVSSREQAERLLEYFTWDAPSGEQGVRCAYLPMMGWLATLNTHCREIIVKKDPQALAFFGDLRNPFVPLKAACEALTESIRRLVERGDHIGRGVYYLTSENYWQAGPERLASTIVSLYKKYKDNNWVRDVLTRIARTGKLEQLREEIFKRHGHNFSSVLSDSLDTSYFLALEKSTDLVALAKAAVVSKTISSATVTLLVQKLSWNYLSPRDIAVLVENQFSVGRLGFELTYLFEKKRIFSEATEPQLYLLSRGLVVRIVKKMSHRAYALDVDKYLTIVTAVLKTLVNRTGNEQSVRVARLYMILGRIIHKHYLNTDSIDEIKSAVLANPVVRFALLRFVAKLKLNDFELRNLLFRYCRLHDCISEDIEKLNDERLTRLYRECQVSLANSIAQSNPESVKENIDKYTISSKVKRKLKSRLSNLSAGQDIDALVWIADWLVQTNGSWRYGEVNFEIFRQAAGAKIANAVQQGLSRLWRTQAPKFDKDNPNTTYYISVACLQGLHLELADGKDLPHLTNQEISQALRYAHIEINGYPKWFWPLVEAYSSIAIPELVSIANEATTSAVAKKHAEKLLVSIFKAPAAVQEALAGPAWSYLLNSSPSGSGEAKQLLKVAFSIPGTVPQDDFETLALQKMKKAYCSPLPETIDATLSSLRSDALTWAIRWLTENPLSWRNAVNTWRASDALAVKAFLFDLAAEIGRDSEGLAVRIAKEKDEEGIWTLEDLFLWTRWAVDPGEDVERPAGIVFTPGQRDHAQRFRDSLIVAIAAATSQAAYSALERLCAKLPSDALTVDYIKRTQFELRERQSVRQPLLQVNYRQFENTFRGDITGTLEFAMAVHADLRAVKYDLEHGELSLRSFFSEIDFCRVDKKGAEGKQAGLALEVHFQRLLASELDHHARARYSVTLEPETAEAKRRDVLCRKGDWLASIELKMSRRWTLKDYLVALEQQLVGQYMRSRNATIGFFVVVLQTKNRIWRDPSSGKRLNFQQVLEKLSEKAQEIESHDRTLYLRVIGIDATVPDD